jgi:hypothetical protein
MILDYRVSNVLHQQPTWRHVQSYSNPNREEMSGNGILSDIANYAKKYGPKIIEGYSNNMATKLRNMLPDSDDNARPGYSGEKHAILQLPNGKKGVANYMGPGTNVVERIKRKDPPRTPADAVARAHDIRYTLAKNVDDLRDADVKMVNKLKTVKDAPMNIFLGKRLIQAKMKAEDYGLLSKDQFNKSFKRPAPADSAILQNALKTMEQQGFGLKLAGAGHNKRRKKMNGGFIFTLAALIAGISSAASAAMATGIPAAMATAALTGAAGAAGAAVVKKMTGSGMVAKLQQVVRSTKVGLNDLTKIGKSAVKKTYKFIKDHPDMIKRGIEMLAPHFKQALANKVKQKLGQSGTGIILAGAGLDKQIASLAMKKLM